MTDLEKLNPQQQEAVCHFEGPLLILAGAGSGKTRVLTNRITWLIEEKGVDPWNILAITFTNKAASEMKNRVEAMAAEGTDRVWVSTFHSTCARILRRFIDRIGFANNFTIYDTDDQKSVVKDICKRYQIDPKQYKERMFLSVISSEKNALRSPEALEKSAGSHAEELCAKVYREYERVLAVNNALDFDDLLGKTVELFEKCEDVLAYYQERFRFILIDEYQDTNAVQFRLVQLLASKYRNLCVVGDDDQSIYKFRGADIGNILNFEKYFPEAKLIRLEQNYRSTQSVLDVANAVISHNTGRKGKTLWTSNGTGSRVLFREFQSGYEEGEYVATVIGKKAGNGSCRYGDFAILYRTNAQSRIFEEKLLYAGIPYRIIGGVNFYARKEIKDLLSYLKTVANGRDDLAARRIINVPKRGIGETTITRISDYAASHGMSFYDAAVNANEIPGLGRGVSKVKAFTYAIQALRAKAEFDSVRQLLEDIIDQTGYVKELELEGTEEARERIENIGELINKAAVFDETVHDGTLDAFLEEVALVADIDSMEEGEDRVLLMTVHSAKGLEFPVVFLAGMEDGVFPSYPSIVSGDTSDIEEERRLCYVGITRAMKELTLTCAKTRMVRGELQFNRVSRFVKEIPEELLGGENLYPQSHSSDNREDRKKESFGTGMSGAYSRKSRMTAQSESFRKEREAFREKVLVPKQFQVKQGQKPQYEEGDTVRHVKFGVGQVVSIVQGGRDYEVTVDFEKYGIKKMFAAFAKLEKL